MKLNFWPKFKIKGLFLSQIVIGSEVDKEYYRNNQQQLVDPELWTETVVDAGCTLDIPLQVDEPGCVIKYVSVLCLLDTTSGVLLSYGQRKSAVVLGTV